MGEYSISIHPLLFTSFVFLHSILNGYVGFRNPQPKQNPVAMAVLRLLRLPLIKNILL